MKNPWAPAPKKSSYDMVENLTSDVSDIDASGETDWLDRASYCSEDQDEYAESFDLIDKIKSETPTHVVVISAQEENWGDSGGDHCPIIRIITPTQLAWLDHVIASQTLQSASDPVWRSIEMAPIPKLPALVERVETFWHIGW
jgi:hypothetical protein